MVLSELSLKDVVNNEDGIKLGKIVDVEVDVATGKVTSIMIANYSETADINVNTGSSNLQVGANLALELPVNIEVENLTITSTEANTKIQLVVKGVE